MSTYVTPADCDEPAVSVLDKHCTEADTLVEVNLMRLGVSPSDLTLPVAALTLLGKYYAIAAALRDKARGQDSTLLEKSASYAKSAKELAGALNRSMLGLDAPDGAATNGAGTGFCRVRRG